MTGVDVERRIVARALEAGASVTPDLAVSLAGYLDLLGRWNQKINLTALDVESASREAIDRLVVEPIVAAAHVRPTDRMCVDVGSGGGSPAIPFKLALPALRMVLVESKGRKAAFLTEALRHLGIVDARVENARFEALAGQSAFIDSADLVTLRAVRVDRKLLAAVFKVLKVGGRLFWFGSGDEFEEAVGSMPRAEVYALLPDTDSQLAVAERILVK